MPQSFKLAIFTSPDQFCQEGPLINALLEEGADLVYLRKSTLTADYVQAFFSHLAPEHHHKMILPAGFRQEAEALGTKWLHVKEAERLFAKYEVKPRFSYSTPVHDLSVLPGLEAHYRMVFFSPVFNSISKPGYGPAVEIQRITADLNLYKESSKQPAQVIALGGITANNITAVKEAGFDGAALMGALWQSPDPVMAFKEIKAGAML